jgi:hypothetical protein
MNMKKTPLVLLCFLFIGITPPDDELVIVLSKGIELSNATLLRLEGDTLVAITKGDTVSVSVNDISEIYSRSLVLGVPGCWFGSGVGALLGASCGAAVEPIDAPQGKVSKGAQIAFGALLGCGLGSIGGCIFFPENERRYVLKDMSPEQRRSAVYAILTRHGSQRQ